jgi:hypothetical protein
MRYFGPRPLIETTARAQIQPRWSNARLGYRFDNGIRVQLDAFNLFNAKADQISYFYRVAIAKLEETVGVADQHSIR